MSYFFLEEGEGLPISENFECDYNVIFLENMCPGP